MDRWQTITEMEINQGEFSVSMCIHVPPRTNEKNPSRSSNHIALNSSSTQRMSRVFSKALTAIWWPS